MTVLPLSYYSSVVLADAPVAYYPLNDAVGSTLAADVSGNRYHGTYSAGGVTLGTSGLLTRDTSDTAAAFDGSSGYVALPSALNPGGWSALTVECWFSLPAALSDNPRFVANAHTDADNTGFELAIDAGNGGNGFAAVGNGTAHGIANWTLSGGTGLALNTPHHYVLTYAAGSGALLAYLDGALVISWSVAGGGAVASSTSPLNIGRDPAYDGDYAHATLAHVAVYNSTLSAARIAAHYTAGSIGAPILAPGPISLYTVKQQLVRVYNPAGTFLGCWTDAPLLAGFKEAINSAPQPLRVTLPRTFDNFDEAGVGSNVGTVGQGNRVDYWLYGPNLPATGLLRFSGHIDKYEPSIAESGEESVTVTVTPLGAAVGDAGVVATLQMGSATATTSSTAVNSAGSATIVVASATGLVVGAYIPIDTGANLEYVTITALSGTSLTATFAKTHSGTYAVGGGLDPVAMFLYFFGHNDPYSGLAYTNPLTLDIAGSLSSSSTLTWYIWQNQGLDSIWNTILLMLRNDSPNWYWRINPAGTVTLNKTPTVSPAQHVFAVGQALSTIQYSKDWMNLANLIVVVGNTTSVSAVATGSDIATFGRRGYSVADTRVTTDAQAQTLANGNLADKDRQIYRGVYRVVDFRGDAALGIGYDIESILVGQSVQLLDPQAIGSVSNGLIWDVGEWDQQVWGGDAAGSSTLSQVVQIVACSYGFDFCDVEVGSFAASQDIALINLAAAFEDFTVVP